MNNVEANSALFEEQEKSGINDYIVGVLANGVPIYSGLSETVSQDALIAAV